MPKGVEPGNNQPILVDNRVATPRYDYISLIKIDPRTKTIKKNKSEQACGNNGGEGNAKSAQRKKRVLCNW